MGNLIIDNTSGGNFLENGKLLFETDYPEVDICGTIWMAKNLEVTTYRNGDPIIELTNMADIAYSGQCYKVPTYGYGNLYNCWAINDARNIAPEGWHVATTTEWDSLMNCLGATGVDPGGIWYSANAYKLKTVGDVYWTWTGGTDEYGFHAKCPGIIITPDNFYYFRRITLWWSAGNYRTYRMWSEDEINLGGLSNTIPNNQNCISQEPATHAPNTGFTRQFFSVRCVKD